MGDWDIRQLSDGIKMELWKIKNYELRMKNYENSEFGIQNSGGNVKF